MPACRARTRRCPRCLPPLQSHVAFFDPDADGIIWPGDTYRGFRRLGFSPGISGLLRGVVCVGGIEFYPPASRLLPPCQRSACCSSKCPH